MQKYSPFANAPPPLADHPYNGLSLIFSNHKQPLCAIFSYKFGFFLNFLRYFMQKFSLSTMQRQ